LGGRRWIPVQPVESTVGKACLAAAFPFRAAVCIFALKSPPVKHRRPAKESKTLAAFDLDDFACSAMSRSIACFGVETADGKPTNQPKDSNNEAIDCCHGIAGFDCRSRRGRISMETEKPCDHMARWRGQEKRRGVDGCGRQGPHDCPATGGLHH